MGKDVRGLRRVRGREHGHRGQYAGLQRDESNATSAGDAANAPTPNATADVGANTAAAIAAPRPPAPPLRPPPRPRPSPKRTPLH